MWEDESVYERKSDEWLLSDRAACITIIRQYRARGNWGQEEWFVNHRLKSEAELHRRGLLTNRMVEEE